MDASGYSAIRVARPLIGLTRKDTGFLWKGPYGKAVREHDTIMVNSLGLTHLEYVCICGTGPSTLPSTHLGYLERR